MVLDSSALVAILLGEPAAARMSVAVAASARSRISAATFVESCIVMVRYRGTGAVEPVERWLADHAVQIDAVSAPQARLARDAYLRFGKGRHAAGLNFGDCFSYALATWYDEPLLFVGDDFGRTDVRVA